MVVPGQAKRHTGLSIVTDCLGLHPLHSPVQASFSLQTRGREIRRGFDPLWPVRIGRRDPW
jgi:hypothetical protein